jgi:hypothetical protein
MAENWEDIDLVRDDPMLLDPRLANYKNLPWRTPPMPDDNYDEEDEDE